MMIQIQQLLHVGIARNELGGRRHLNLHMVAECQLIINIAYTNMIFRYVIGSCVKSRRPSISRCEPRGAWVVAVGRDDAAVVEEDALERAGVCKEGEAVYFVVRDL